MKLNRKNRMLLLGFIVTLYICYTFAFSNTVDYYRHYQSQKELAANNLNDFGLLQQLIQKERQLDSLLEQYTMATGSSFQNELLNRLTHFSNAHNLKIIDFKEPHIFTENNLKTSSYIFTLEGSFNGILLLINSIENDPSLGSVQHIFFIKRRNYKNNSDYLRAEIVLQKSESIDNIDLVTKGSNK